MKIVSILALIAIVLTTILGCTPKTPVTPAPATPSEAPKPALQPLATAKISAGTDWDKVVEAGKKEGRVTFYATLFTQVEVPVDKVFYDRYGIKLDVLGGRSAEWTERLKVEKRMGQMTGDVVQGSTAGMNIMKQLGLLATNPDLPALNEKGVWALDPNMIDKDRKQFMYMAWLIGPHINTNLVKPEEAVQLQSWRDFLAPKWKGRMSVAHPNLSSALYDLLTLDKPGRFNTREYLQELSRQDVRLSISPASIASELAKGEVAVALTGSTTTTASMAAKGAPIRMLSMKEGIVGTSSSIAQVEGAPHSSAAKVFINWLFTQEGQEILSRAFLNSPLRRGVPDFTHESIKVKPEDVLIETSEITDMVTESFAKREFVSLFK